MNRPTPFYNKAYELSDLAYLEDEIALLKSREELTPIDSNRYWEYGKVLKSLKEFVPKPSNLLEIGGCGSSLAATITTLGHSVLSTDVDPRIEATVNSYTALGYKNLSWKIASADNLPFASDSFDCVLCISTIEHILDHFTCIREMISVTKPGGYIVLSFDFTGEIREATCHQVHLFTEEQVVEMIHYSPLVKPIESWDYSQKENNIICYGDPASVYNGAMLIVRKND